MNKFKINKSNQLDSLLLLQLCQWTFRLYSLITYQRSISDWNIFQSWSIRLPMILTAVIFQVFCQ